MRQRTVKPKHVKNILWLPFFLLGVNFTTPAPSTETPLIRTEAVLADDDQDGYSAPADCDDWDASINPGATEICNFRDDDCDGQVDEGCKVYYRDSDGDNYGLWTEQVREMVQPPGFSTVGGDCNDGNAAVHPGAAETCNNIDDNCNGFADEGCRDYYRDADNDGFGDQFDVYGSPTQPPGYVLDDSDCDDNDASVNPSAIEVCNGKDDDCDNIIDEGCQLYFRDADSDGWGNEQQTRMATSQPPGYVTIGEDCNDFDSQINPGKTEICNFRDDDCDGQVDEGCFVWYLDGDDDGWGLWHVQIRAMSQPPGYAIIGGDCNDANPAIHPGAPEIPNGIDDNCNALVDESSPALLDDLKFKAVAPHSAAETIDLNVAAFPNPATKQFTVQLRGDPSGGSINVRVLDSHGRVSEIKNNLQPNQTITIGAGYPKGLYFLEATQGKNRKMVKIIKT